MFTRSDERSTLILDFIELALEEARRVQAHNAQYVSEKK
jgi:hypothetical protein